jgi:hypothetical protein
LSNHTTNFRLVSRLAAPGRLPLPKWWFLGLLIALTIWGMTDVRRRGYFNPQNPDDHKTDFTVYTEAGAAFFDGRPPYEVANPRGWCYLYPPMFALILAPLHNLTMQDQVTLWFFISLLICWGCYRESLRILDIVNASILKGDRPFFAGRKLEPSPTSSVSHPRSPSSGAESVLQNENELASLDVNCPRAKTTVLCPAWLGWLAVATAALPTLNCLQRGQVGVLKLYLLLLGARLILGGRSYRAWLGGGIVLSMPIVMKIIPIVPVGFFFFAQFISFYRHQWSKRFLVSLGGMAVGLLLFVLLIPAALIGWNDNLRHLNTWADFMLYKADDGGTDPRSGNSHSLRNQSLQNAVYRAGNFAAYAFADGPDDRLVEGDSPPPMLMDKPAVQSALAILRGLLALGLVLTGVRLGWRGDDFTLAVAFSLGCAAMLVVSPIARGHYFMLLAPAVLLFPMWLRQREMPRAAILMAIWPAALVLLHYILLNQAGRLGVLGIGVAAWLVAAMALVLRTPARGRG